MGWERRQQRKERERYGMLSSTASVLDEREVRQRERKRWRERGRERERERWREGEARRRVTGAEGRGGEGKGGTEGLPVLV